MNKLSDHRPAQPLDAALDLASAGLRIFPVFGIVDGKCTCGKECDKNAGKHPATDSGFKDATIDVAQIKRWWKENPAFNIGLPTGVDNDILCWMSIPTKAGKKASPGSSKCIGR